MEKINKLEEVRHIITMHCNLECLHCYLKGGGKNNFETIRVLPEQVLDHFYLKYQPDVVSATGGEPLLQVKFLIQLFTKLKEENIHTCIDTSRNSFFNR